MQTKKARLQRLQKRISEMAAKISREMVGTEQVVLVDGFSKKSDDMIAGRTENNRVVNFARSEDLIGQLACVQITEALPNSLRGRLV